MSDINTKIVKVNISDHPNADKLELATINSEVGGGGYVCVVGLGQFQTGDLVIYVEPGSVVPENIQEHLSKNKIQIKGGRIRAINIRGVLSEGLCLKPSDWLGEGQIFEDNDITKLLQIKKYEPPPPSARSVFGSGKGINNNYINENFKRYDCVSHFKKYPNVIKEGEEVVVTVKRHGTSHRAGWVDKPDYKKSWWENLWIKILGEDKKEFLVGSHNKIRYLNKTAIEYKTYESDLYWRVATKYNIKSVTRQIAETSVKADGSLPDVVIYGEAVGPRIQVGYSYGVPDGEVDLCVFDIMIDGKFLDWSLVKHYCNCFNLPTVEDVYTGPWDLKLLELAETVDEYNGKKYNREGLVIRPTKERFDKCGRVMLKLLNPVYLLDKRNSDNH